MEHDIKNKNYTASFITEVSRDASPMEDPGWDQKVDFWFNLFRPWSGNQNWQSSNLGLSDIKSTERKPKMKKMPKMVKRRV